MNTAADHAPTRPSEVLAEADALVASDRIFDAIELLTAANERQAESPVECRIAELRYAAFAKLQPRNRFERWPAPVAELDDGPPRIPEIDRSELDPEVVRRHILSHGAVRVNGLLEAPQIQTFVEGIDHALEVRDLGPNAERTSWYGNLPLPKEQAQSLGRHWVAGSGGLLTCDSPKMLFELFRTYEAVGLRDLVTGYLGERPILSGNKCTLRRVPLRASTDWHQDGAFLGRGIRALNVWLALSDCGVDSPGIDLVPRRFDHVLETGTGGSIFDWAVGPAVVEQLAVDAPVVRPQFRAGDALLFDDLFLHRTAIGPEMTRERYAIEAWFFAPTDYPSGQVPLVW